MKQLKAEGTAPLWFEDISDFSSRSGFAGPVISPQSPATNVITITFDTDNDGTFGDPFNLSSLLVAENGSANGAQFTIRPDGNNALAEVFTDNTAAAQAFIPSNATNFSNITSLEIVKTSGSDFFFIDDLVVSVPVLGLEDVSRERSIETYPNPVDDVLHIKTNDLEVYGVALYDMLGKSIESIEQQNKIVDFFGLDKGLYFLEVRTEQGTAVQRIVKK